MKARPDDLLSPDETNRRFAAEAERFDLQFRCASCAHVHRSSLTCSFGFPNRGLVGAVRVLDEQGRLTFCKSFELGETLETAG